MDANGEIRRPVLRSLNQMLQSVVEIKDGLPIWISQDFVKIEQIRPTSYGCACVISSSFPGVEYYDSEKKRFDTTINFEVKCYASMKPATFERARQESINLNGTGEDECFFFVPHAFYNNDALQADIFMLLASDVQTKPLKNYAEDQPQPEFKRRTENATFASATASPFPDQYGILTLQTFSDTFKHFTISPKVTDIKNAYQSGVKNLFRTVCTMQNALLTERQLYVDFCKGGLKMCHDTYLFDGFFDVLSKNVQCTFRSKKAESRATESDAAFEKNIVFSSILGCFEFLIESDQKRGLTMLGHVFKTVKECTELTPYVKKNVETWIDSHRDVLQRGSEYTEHMSTVSELYLKEGEDMFKCDDIFLKLFSKDDVLYIRTVYEMKYSTFLQALAEIDNERPLSEFIEYGNSVVNCLKEYHEPVVGAPLPKDATEENSNASLTFDFIDRICKKKIKYKNREITYKCVFFGETFYFKDFRTQFRLTPSPELVAKNGRVKIRAKHEQRNHETIQDSDDLKQLFAPSVYVENVNSKVSKVENERVTPKSNSGKKFQTFARCISIGLETIKDPERKEWPNVFAGLMNLACRVQRKLIDDGLVYSDVHLDNCKKYKTSFLMIDYGGIASYDELRLDNSEDNLKAYFRFVFRNVKIDYFEKETSGNYFVLKNADNLDEQKAMMYNQGIATALAAFSLEYIRSELKVEDVDQKRRELLTNYFEKAVKNQSQYLIEGDDMIQEYGRAWDTILDGNPAFNGSKRSLYLTLLLSISGYELFSKPLNAESHLQNADGIENVHQTLLELFSLEIFKTQEVLEAEKSLSDRTTEREKRETAAASVKRFKDVLRQRYMAEGAVWAAENAAKRTEDALAKKVNANEYVKKARLTGSKLTRMLKEIKDQVVNLKEADDAIVRIRYVTEHAKGHDVVIFTGQRVVDDLETILTIADEISKGARVVMTDANAVFDKAWVRRTQLTQAKKALKESLKLGDQESTQERAAKKAAVDKAIADAIEVYGLMPTCTKSLKHKANFVKSKINLLKPNHTFNVPDPPALESSDDRFFSFEGELLIKLKKDQKANVKKATGGENPAANGQPEEDGDEEDGAEEDGDEEEGNEEEYDEEEGVVEPADGTVAVAPFLVDGDEDDAPPPVGFDALALKNSLFLTRSTIAEYSKREQRVAKIVVRHLDILTSENGHHLTESEFFNRIAREEKTYDINGFFKNLTRYVADRYFVDFFDDPDDQLSKEFIDAIRGLKITQV